MFTKIINWLFFPSTAVKNEANNDIVEYKIIKDLKNNKIVDLPNSDKSDDATGIKSNITLKNILVESSPNVNKDSGKKKFFQKMSRISEASQSMIDTNTNSNLKDDDENFDNIKISPRILLSSILNRIESNDKKCNREKVINRSIESDTKDYSFFCDNCTSNLHHIVNTSSSKKGNSNFRKILTCPDFWKPPITHGLDNSNPIIPDYYLTNNNNYKNGILEIEYLSVIKDNIRNMRSLNPYQIFYIETLPEKEKDAILDEFIKSFNCMTEYIGHVKSTVNSPELSRRNSPNIDAEEATNRSPYIIALEDISEDQDES